MVYPLAGNHEEETVMMERYPRLEINLAHLKDNVAYVVEKCGSCGIQVAGVIKGANGDIEVA